MTEQDVIERIHEAIREAGSQKAFAARAGISAQYLADILRGRRAISDRVAAAVGVEIVRSVEYRLIADR